MLLFLLSKLKEDLSLISDVKENDGWLTMETMLKFKRLSALSSDVKEVHR